MMQQALVQIRVDRPLKEDVSKIFSALGIDISTAVRMFFQRCKRVKGIPFTLTVEDSQLPRRIGVAKGKIKAPADLEMHNAEIAELFGGAL